MPVRNWQFIASMLAALSMLFRSALLTSILMLVAASDAGAATLTNSTLELAAVDRFIIAQMTNQGIPGLALAITRNDQVIYVRGYGNARKGAPVTEKIR